MKAVLQSLKIMLALTLLCGGFYPALVTVLAQVALSGSANGSLVSRNGQIVGSELIAQKFTRPEYFWPRPSAIDFNPLPSGGSNLSPASAGLKSQVEERRQKLMAVNSLNLEIPQDLLFASASGLDPHISPAAARFQVARVAAARSLPTQQLISLIDKIEEKRQFGILGEPRINVLKLNLALDGIKEAQK